MKEPLRNIDLYSLDVAAMLMHDIGFKTFSFCRKAIPTEGSPCRKVNPNRFKVFPIEGKVLHRDGSVTLKTTSGNLRFWK